MIGRWGQDVGSGRAVRPGLPNREGDRLDRSVHGICDPYFQVNRLA
jgi:hypothetical protein